MTTLEIIVITVCASIVALCALNTLDNIFGKNNENNDKGE
jgi:hypothetical protein